MWMEKPPFGLEAAQKLGANPEQVFKTLLIVQDKDFAVAVVSGRVGS